MTDPQTLLVQAAAYSAYANAGVEGQLLKLALLKQILLAQNPNAMTDPLTLLSQAAAYSAYVNANPVVGQLLELALLSQISGTGGSSGVVTGNYGGVNPNFTPTSSGAVAIDTSNGRIWWYYNSTWH